MNSVVYTLGHSTHPIERLIDLLKSNTITAVCDVRSSPYSRVNPQFNRESLRETLRTCGIKYVFLGKELGARTTDRSCYSNGKVQYDRLARTELFQNGLQRVLKGAELYRISLLCAEKDPIFCHRMVLISPCLAERGVAIRHILGNGAVETQDGAAERLLQRFRISDRDLFRPREDALAEAMRRQAETIAYEEDTDLTRRDS